MVNDTKENNIEFLVGRCVSRIYLDFALGIQFFGKGIEITIRIEGITTFRDSGKAIDLSADAAENLAPALKIFNKHVSAATIHPDGTLSLSFPLGITIEAHPHPKYESWELVVSDGRKWICLPGGKVARWGRIRD